MLYSCAAKEVTKAVKDSAWSLAKGIMGNKNSNPRPREREREETLFLGNAGARVTKIPRHPFIAQG